MNFGQHKEADLLLRYSRASCGQGESTRSSSTGSAASSASTASSLRDRLSGLPPNQEASGAPTIGSSRTRLRTSKRLPRTQWRLGHTRRLPFSQLGSTVKSPDQYEVQGLLTIRG